MIEDNPRHAILTQWDRVQTALKKRIPPPKAVCPDLLIGVKSMAYVMRYNHFPD